MSVHVLYVHALSPLHAGTGQSVGAIELALARDRATGFPYLPGSSLKGSLRARATQENRANVTGVFGPETKLAHEHAGAVAIGDANLLLLPLRSIKGTFAWATSPYLLARFARDLAEAGKALLPALTAPGLEEVLLTSTSSLSMPGAGGKHVVVFEDLDLASVTGNQGPLDELAKYLGRELFPAPADSAWVEGLKKRLCVVHDDVMAFFSEHATDVVARVALKNDTKTVENLWHEENLPTESVLVSLVATAPNRKTQLDDAGIFAELAHLAATPMQLGGKATVGRGRCRLVLGGAK